MAIVLDRDIERAVEERLSPVRPAQAAPPSRRAAPVVRFSPLFAETPPAARRSRRTLVWLSVAVHVVLFTVVALMPRRAQSLDGPPLPIEIVFTTPMPDIPETPPMPALKKDPPKPKPRPEPRIEPPPVAEAPKPPPKPVVPEIEAAPVAKVEPPRPRPAVRTGLLDADPSGPAIVASRSSRSTIVAASGFDASATASSSSGSSGRPGHVMDVAFESAPTSRGGSRRSGGVVKESGFGEEAAAAAPRKREPERPLSALDSEVEILSKPKPVYTEEARGLRLEGDVVLSVVFEASGVLRVVNVAQGLGHGLDEAAIDAARKIRFNPARRDGAPVDHQAKLRVVFRLA